MAGFEANVKDMIPSLPDEKTGIDFSIRNFLFFPFNFGSFAICIRFDIDFVLLHFVYLSKLPYSFN